MESDISILPLTSPSMNVHKTSTYKVHDSSDEHMVTWAELLDFYQNTLKNIMCFYKEKTYRKCSWLQLSY